MAKKPIIVAVDGPAGSGKSSLCSVVAKKIGWTTLNTGLIYRSVAYVGMKKGLIQTEGTLVTAVDEPALIALAESLVNDLRWDGERAAIFWKGEDLTEHLSDPIIAQGSSFIAKISVIRKVLLEIQRSIALKAQVGIFVDGRDIGSVVFPDADLKIFMTASLEERARRRFAQMHREDAEGAGASTEMQKLGDFPSSLSLQTIQRDIAARDQQDSTRQSAPLVQGEDAVLFDTSAWDFDASVSRLLELLRSRKLIH